MKEMKGLSSKEKKKALAAELEGKVFQSKFDGKYKVVKYHNSGRVDVVFLDTGYEMTTSAKSAKGGAIRDKLNMFKKGDRIKSADCGWVVITYYNSCSDIGVMFEDTGWETALQAESLRKGKMTDRSLTSDRGGYSRDIKVGQVHTSNLCGDYEVIEVYNSRKTKVRFLSTGFERTTSIVSIFTGKIKDPYHPQHYGVGYLGKGDYTSRASENVISFAYRSWTSMLKRVYSPKYLAKSPNYLGCSVCDEWLNYQNYAAWCDTQYHEDDWQLEKDILVKGNRVYSPDTCRFAPPPINYIINLNSSSRGTLPVGVHYRTDCLHRYSASIQDWDRRKIGLGRYATAEDAFYLGYKPAKEAKVKEIADKYKGRICDDLYEALYAWTVNIDD